MAFGLYLGVLGCSFTYLRGLGNINFKLNACNCVPWLSSQGRVYELLANGGYFTSVGTKLCITAKYAIPWRIKEFKYIEVVHDL